MIDATPAAQPGIPDGLRARKRAATRASIEKVAIELALNQGYENVTVDMICEASMVSQRTFFNYFGSKEGVILGLMPEVMTDADAEIFIASRAGDVVHDLVERMATALIDPAADRAALEARVRIVHSSPELLGKQMEWMAAQEQRLIEVVFARFRAAGRTEIETPDLLAEAAMVVSLAITVLRFTMLQQFSGVPGAGAGAPAASAVPGAPVAPTTVALQHALTLIERILSPGNSA